MTDHDPTLLTVPVERVAVPDVPIPYARSLEFAVLPAARPDRGGDPPLRRAMTDVLFPALSKETPDAEGVLSTWFVRDGETVRVDQLLAEVQVDKVAADVPSPAAGVVHILVEEEATVLQSTPIARID